MSLPTQARMFTGRLDVAPFACVFFLLLIFLLFLTHLVPVPGVGVRLPETSVLEVGSAPDWLVVVMDDEGRLYFNQQITSEERLREDLTRRVKGGPPPGLLVLQAGARVRLQDLVRFYALCRQAGVEEIKLQTRQPVFGSGNAIAPR